MALVRVRARSAIDGIGDQLAALRVSADGNPGQRISAAPQGTVDGRTPQRPREDEHHDRTAGQRRRVARWSSNNRKCSSNSRCLSTSCWKRSNWPATSTSVRGASASRWTSWRWPSTRPRQPQPSAMRPASNSRTCSALWPSRHIGAPKAAGVPCRRPSRAWR